MKTAERVCLRMLRSGRANGREVVTGQVVDAEAVEARQLLRKGWAVRAFEGPCDRDTVRCAAATDYHSRTPDCCRRGIIDVTDYTLGLLEREGIPYWLDYGSLLGAERHKGLIPHDKDSDIGCLAADRKRVLGLVPEIQGAGYDTHYRTAGPLFSGGDRLKVRWSAANHSNIDVFFWERRPDGTRHRKAYIACDRYKGREFPEDRLLPLGHGEWEGRRVSVPKDVEWFLVHRYGENWKQPIAANHDGKRR